MKISQPRMASAIRSAQGVSTLQKCGLRSPPTAAAGSFYGEEVARLDMNVSKAGEMLDLTA